MANRMVTQSMTMLSKLTEKALVRRKLRQVAGGPACRCHDIDLFKFTQSIRPREFGKVKVVTPARRDTGGLAEVTLFL